MQQVLSIHFPAPWEARALSGPSTTGTAAGFKRLHRCQITSEWPPFNPCWFAPMPPLWSDEVGWHFGVFETKARFYLWELTARGFGQTLFAWIFLELELKAMDNLKLKLELHTSIPWKCIFNALGSILEERLNRKPASWCSFHEINLHRSSLSDPARCLAVVHRSCGIRVFGKFGVRRDFYLQVDVSLPGGKKQLIHCYGLKSDVPSPSSRPIHMLKS